MASETPRPSEPSQPRRGDDSDRTVLTVHGPEGNRATLTVMRLCGMVWLVLDVAIKPPLDTVVVMTDAEAVQLVDALRAASR